MINLNNSFIKLLTVIHNRLSSCPVLPYATTATTTSLYYTVLFPLLLPIPNSNLAAWSATHQGILNTCLQNLPGFCQFLVILPLDPITLNCTFFYNHPASHINFPRSSQLYQGSSSTLIYVRA
jgi:hypothetical protein